VLPTVTIIMLAAMFMIFAGCFRNVEEAYKRINWESVALIAAMLPVATAIEKTGVTAVVTKSLVESVGSLGPHALLGIIYYATSLVTLFLSNTATTVLFAPIALRAALALDLSPYPFLFAVAVSACMCFASPFSTPANALVMSPGRYTFMDYVKIGVPMQLLYGVVMLAVLPVLFPFAVTP
jgi:di/tricarboxylate transporter